MSKYIGDSVYMEIDETFDPPTIILTTNNGYPDDPRNRIVLEPETMMSFNLVLCDYKATLKEKETDG